MVCYRPVTTIFHPHFESIHPGGLGCSKGELVLQPPHVLQEGLIAHCCTLLALTHRLVLEVQRGQLAPAGTGAAREDQQYLPGPREPYREHVWLARLTMNVPALSPATRLCTSPSAFLFPSGTAGCTGFVCHEHLHCCLATAQGQSHI